MQTALLVRLYAQTCAGFAPAPELGGVGAVQTLGDDPHTAREPRNIMCNQQIELARSPYGWLGLRAIRGYAAEACDAPSQHR